jgi:HD-GYP domain-containing protein (c-di-GMP phosphodiesterase class II)
VGAENAVMPCMHEAPHTATASFDSGLGFLRFVLICDACGAERRELGALRHRVEARPHVNGLAERVARQLALPESIAERIRLASLVRDVGKQLLPPEILDKPGPLSDPEWDEVRRHPELGAGLLGGAAFDDVRGWVVHHHERWDGRGYPFGLSGGEIPLEARVLAVVDAYEAMTSDRAYRPAMGHDRACREIWSGAGTQFDIAVVAAFTRAVDGPADTARTAAASEAA